MDDLSLNILFLCGYIYIVMLIGNGIASSRTDAMLISDSFH